jgi:dolichol-phosphate mannosyltransferase
MKNNFLLSVIIPVYNESGNIKALLSRLMPTVSKYTYEVVFVNDGSTDNTVQEIKAECTRNPAVKLISFTRNFGHQNALSAGYQYTKGDCVVTIDADLQDPPELIDKMIGAWKKGFEIVYAHRQSRRTDSIFKKTTAWMFYWLINQVSEVRIPADVGDYRLLDRSVVEFLNGLPEYARFLRGLVAWSGYKTTYVDFDRSLRHSGDTHYPFRKMFSFAVMGITAFSTKPLRVVVYFGFLTATVGFLGMAYAFLRRLMPHQYWVTGWTAIFVSITFFSGVQIFILGVIGEYIGRIFTQVQGRPLYLVKETVNIESSPVSSS